MFVATAYKYPTPERFLNARPLDDVNTKAVLMAVLCGLMDQLDKRWHELSMHDTPARVPYRLSQKPIGPVEKNVARQ